MSLQTEIAIIKVRKRKDFLGIDLADEIINKILDAFSNEIDSEAAVNEVHKMEYRRVK